MSSAGSSSATSISSASRSRMALAYSVRLRRWSVGRPGLGLTSARRSRSVSIYLTSAFVGGRVGPRHCRPAASRGCAACATASPRWRRSRRDWRSPRPPGSIPPAPWDRYGRCRNRSSRFARPTVDQTSCHGRWSRERNVPWALPRRLNRMRPRVPCSPTSVLGCELSAAACPRKTTRESYADASLLARRDRVARILKRPISSQILKWL